MVRICYEKLYYKKTDVSENYCIYVGKSEEAGRLRFEQPRAEFRHGRFHIVLRKRTGIPLVETLVAEWTQESPFDLDNAVRSARRMIGMGDIPSLSHDPRDAELERAFSGIDNTEDYYEPAVDIDDESSESQYQTGSMSMSNNFGGSLPVSSRTARALGSTDFSNMNEWNPDAVHRQYRSYKKAIVREKWNASMKNDFTLYQQADILEKDADTVYEEWKRQYYGDETVEQKALKSFREEWEKEKNKQNPAIIYIEEPTTSKRMITINQAREKMKNELGDKE